MTKPFAFLIAFCLLAISIPGSASATSPVMCTMQYQPVCGTDMNGKYKTYGNSCTLGAENGTYQHEGECTDAELRGTQEGTYVPPAHCTAWYDGCNSCSRTEDGNAVCTLRGCMGTPAAGYCTAYGETSTDVAPAPPVPAPEVSVEASSTQSLEAQPLQETPGFFARIWTSIATWFGNLF
ncbi:MAG TPA: hypothetical protein PK609_02050 [Candidatus Paceibacterota bacterium]|nr:hypothetical protein [Candidatus Paceibacterota bacterium]